MTDIVFKHTVAERFLRYVQIDTQSDAQSVTQPSTEKQKNLSTLLVSELLEMGVDDAHLDEFGYVYATIPANTGKKNVATLCFCAHVDTAPDCSGANVRPVVHRNYQGQDLSLPDAPGLSICPSDYPELNNQIGADVITAGGLTLLGADDKAGIAEIMDAAYQFVNRPDLIHGKIRLLFTPDEEIGRGVNKVDLKKLGAEVGYTLDGGTAGDIEDETFSADGATITIKGVASHPGYAKGKMENALKIAAEIVAALPPELSPETTDGKEGFIHPVHIEGALETATIQFIIRDFTEEGLTAHLAVLRQNMDWVMKKYPGSEATLTSFEQYRNMKFVVDQRPEIIQYATEAVRRAGLTPRIGSIRGGTDGSRLSQMGLPCPNLFAGEQAIHSVKEWISIRDMEKAVQTIILLSMIWEEKA